MPSLFDGIPVAVISDAIDSLGLPNTVLQHDIRCMAGRHLVGRARTINKCNALFIGAADPSLDLGAQQVIDESNAGNVIVVASQGDLSSSVFGGNMAIRAAALGVAGVVTDGATRDIDEIEELGLTIFARGTTPRQSPRRMITTSINEPVMCGGVLINPDDFIVGDRDGVVAIAHGRAEAVAEKARAILDIETTMQKFIREGNSLVAAIRKYKQR
jgi:regulator of RNase E activity RraA